MVRAAPRWLRDLGFTSWLLVGRHAAARGRRLAARADPDDRHAADRGRRHRGGRVAGRGVAQAPRGPARAAARCCCCSRWSLVGALVVVVIVGGISSESASISNAHLLGRDDGPGLAEGPGDRPEERELGDDRRAQRDELDGPGAAARRHRRRGEAVVAGVLPRADAAQPGVPAQGRADDPRLGRASRGRARRGRAHGQRPDPAVAARLLLRGHDRGRVQRGRGRRRGADPRHPAGGDDRRGDVRRRLHPLPRRLDRRRVRGAARARRRGRGGGAGDDRDPAARQRRPAAARPADRLRRRAGHPPAGGARGHDRRRRAVRRRGPDPRRADDVGGHAASSATCGRSPRRPRAGRSPRTRCRAPPHRRPPARCADGHARDERGRGARGRRPADLPRRRARGGGGDAGVPLGRGRGLGSGGGGGGRAARPGARCCWTSTCRTWTGSRPRGGSPSGARTSWSCS